MEQSILTMLRARIRDLILKNVGKANGTLVINFVLGPKEALYFEVFEAKPGEVELHDRELWKGTL